MIRMLLALAAALCGAAIPGAHAQALDVFTDNAVYSDGSPMFIYGKAASGEDLIIRLIAPDETIAKFDQITAAGDGTFSYLLQTWPEASVSFPYGTYAVEVISTARPGLSGTVEVKFSADTDLVRVPVERHLSTLVFAPETAAVGKPLRIFVQTTSDGLLVGQNNPGELLHTSHVHLPDGRVDDISSEFITLHSGLYFADYVPDREGTHVFHVVSSNQGSVSHGSAATSVLSQDLGGISEEIVRLNSILDETAGELETLRDEVSDFGVILDAASGKIDSSVAPISSSVENIVEASSQLNSMLIPVVTSIGIIVALQLAILARRR